MVICWVTMESTSVVKQTWVVACSTLVWSNYLFFVWFVAIVHGGVLWLLLTKPSISKYIFQHSAMSSSTALRLVTWSTIMSFYPCKLVVNVAISPSGGDALQMTIVKVAPSMLSIVVPLATRGTIWVWTTIHVIIVWVCCATWTTLVVTTSIMFCGLH